MAVATQQHNVPLMLLSLDNGGLRGLAELYILEHIMEKLQHQLKLESTPRPCDVFHLIGGSGSGGIIALFLGRMQMTTKEAISAYQTLCRSTYSERKWNWQNGAFKASKLENAIKAAAKEKCKDPEAVMLDEQDMGKTVVFALSDNNMETPFRLRTYKSDSNCKAYPIWAAARATTVSPSFFRDLLIDELSPIGEDFHTATLKCSNPSKDLLDEASAVFGDGRKLGCLLSLGSGNATSATGELILGLKTPDRFQKTLPKETLEEIKRANTEAEEIAKEVEPIFAKYEKAYARLTPEFGPEGITLEEWEKVNDVQAATGKYLLDSKNLEIVDRVVKGLAARGSEVVGLRVQAPSLRTLLTAKTNSQDGSAANSIVGPTLLVPGFRNKEFIGREDIICALEDKLSLGNKGTDGRVALLGEDGNGKTEIALEFAYRRNELDSQNIYWVPADSGEVFTTAYYEIAREKDITISGLKRQEVLKAVQRALEDSAEEGDRWLLIADGAEDPDLPEFQHLPKTGGQIIFTTNNKEVVMKHVDGADAVIEVPGFTEDEALSMVSSLSVGGIAKQLVKDLDLSPLAISLAVAHLRHTHVSIDEYYRIYQRGLPKLQEIIKKSKNSPFLPEYMSTPILATWQMSFDYLANEHPESAVMLNYLSQFHHNEIPGNLIADLADTPMIPLDNSRRVEGIEVLKNFGLISKGRIPNTFNIHRLVRLSVLNNLLSSQTYQPMIWGLVSADSVFPDPRYDNFGTCLELQPHALEAIKAFREIKNEIQVDRFTAKAYYELQLRLARHLFLEGNIALALKAQTEVLDELQKDKTRKAARRVSGVEELYLTALTSKALSLFHLSSFHKARETLTEAHKLTAARYGDDSDFALRTLASICRVDSALGSSAEAELNLREIINRLASLRGVDDSLMSIMNDLALVMIESHKLDDAVATFKEVHDWYLSTSPPNPTSAHPHPKVVMQALHTISSLIELSNCEFQRIESIEFLLSLEPTLRLALGEGHIATVWICLVAGINGVEGEVERVEDLVRYILAAESDKAASLSPSESPSLIQLRMYRLLALILTPTDPEEALTLFAQVRRGWEQRARERYRSEIAEVVEKVGMLEEALRRHYVDVLVEKGRPRAECAHLGLAELRKEAGVEVKEDEEAAEVERGRKREKGKGRA